MNTAPKPQRATSMDLPQRLLFEAAALIACKGRCNESSDVLLLREAAEYIAALAPPSGDEEKVISMLLECGYVDKRNLAQARRIVAGLAQNKVDHQEDDQ